MREVVIIDGVRSPVGRHNGSLSAVRPDDLLAEVLKGLQARSGFDPAIVEDVYMGCGNQAGEDNRDDVNIGAFQPFGLYQLGKGRYLRSTGIWIYNFDSDTYTLPIGMFIFFNQ